MSIYLAKFIGSIDEINKNAWNTLFPHDHPFVRHEFLSALEMSSCIGKNTGWLPQYLTIFQGETLVAAMPCFIKTHSYGEYVFDWSWAEAYQRHGLRYYPKLVCSVPYTPATGPRLGLGEGLEFADISGVINDAMNSLASQIGASCCQLLFPVKCLSDDWQRLGWTQRVDAQYHWFNRDYASMDDFLARFASRKRKNFKKERAKVQQQGIVLRVVEGKDIGAELWHRFYQFYHSTYLKRAQSPGYLNQEFFYRLGETIADQLVMFTASKDGDVIAAALCFKSDDTLFGRYWGCAGEYEFLHFETCYYQGIEYCIKNKLQKFDPGAQGEHKIQRGFEPVLTYSNHRIFHPAFNEAITQFIQEETLHIQQYIEQAREGLPFKKME